MLLFEEETTPDELWSSMKETLKATAQSILGKRQRSHKSWITEETLAQMEHRRKLKLHRARSDDDNKAYKSAKAAVQRHARQDKKKWLTEQCAEIEAVSYTHLTLPTNREV